MPSWESSFVEVFVELLWNEGSSIATIRRYRAASDYLIRFVENGNGVPSADALTLSTAEPFARYLRQVKVSPNGHPNTARQTLRDKGIIFILETCRASWFICCCLMMSILRGA